MLYDIKVLTLLNRVKSILWLLQKTNTNNIFINEIRIINN